MTNDEIKELVEVLLPYIRKELRNDSDFKTNVKRKNATVVSIKKDAGGSTVRQTIRVALPFDEVDFPVKNETGQELSVGDLVCIEYCIDLKNAVAVYKV